MGKRQIMFFVGGAFLVLLIFVIISLMSNNQAKKNGNQPPVITQTVNSQKTYTVDEVAGHNTESDCWMAIENRVYDVTQFVGKHPGGKAILGGCGKEATAMFNSRPTTGKPHSDQARKILNQYQIGSLNQ